MESKERMYASQRVAKAMSEAFGNEGTPFKAQMRPSKDVSLFIKKIEAAHERASRSKLTFP